MMRYFTFVILVAFCTPNVYPADAVKQLTIDDVLAQNRLEAKKQGHGPNRLIQETSPYLLQHAYNPVNWYAWGEEAFAKAKKENKPIFLSIGYSTCHWCHVMAHESFEDKDIAAYLNKFYVCIKVDREQRPDVDAVYMSATQLINGHGGWPMSVFLDHELRPFHAATYYPPHSIDNRQGLDEVLRKIHDLWVNKPALIDQVAASVTKKISLMADDTSDHSKLSDDVGVQALKQIASSFDEDSGGFSAAPKFPRPGIFALLNQQAAAGDVTAKMMMKTTLDAMLAGGIYDHVAGGFHRYSVDENWQVPHFEKMLYNQALNVIAYSDLYRSVPEPVYKKAVYETLDFVLKEMASADTGFYSALDADSERPYESSKHAEGAYYLWYESELKKYLSEAEYEFIKQYFHILEHGNIYSDPQNEFVDLNILYVDEEFRHQPLTEEQSELLESAKNKLSKQRLTRPRPHLDDKIITAWNGMMLYAYANAAVVFEDDKLLEVALSSLEFIKDHLYDRKSQTLYRHYRIGSEGKTDGVVAGLSDYAWVIHGLLEVYEAGKDKRWLSWAVDLQNKQDELFLDEIAGAYYESAESGLLFRSKSIFDGALPSANAIAQSNLLKLSEYMTSSEHRDVYRKKAERLVDSFATAINQNPAAASMLLAVELYEKRHEKERR